MNWKILTEAPDEIWTRKWDDFLTRAEMPTHYTTPDFFADPFIRGGERFAVLALKNDEITGVLTAVDAGKQIVSGLFNRPQVALSKDADKFQAVKNLVEGVFEKGGSDLEMAEIFSWQALEDFETLGFNFREYGGEQGTVVLDLTKGEDELFKDFSQTRRNEIRKAIRQNEVQISEVENLDELAELYEIHRDWCARKGNEPDTFEQIKQAFSRKNHRKIFIAKHEGKVIAGSFYRFCRGGIVEYAGNNSLVAYQKLRPNDLIGWHSIQWACRENFRLYSMGGAHLFLRRFGGEIVPTYRYKIDRSLLKIHNLSEAAKDFGIRTYRSLPQPVKAKLKQVLGRN